MTFMPVRTCTSRIATYHPLKALPPLPPSSPGTPDIMQESDIELPLMKENLPSIPSAKSAWIADAADLFVLLCSFLLITASIVLVALTFHTQLSAWESIPSNTLSIFQRIISALSVTITSAVIMVAGKRYVLFKLARGGLRSQRVAVYNNPTIGNLASYLVLHGAELPLLGLSVVWGLALVTGLTVNDSWEMGSISSWAYIGVLSGPLDRPTSGSSWVVPAIEQLTFVMSSWCLGLTDTIGLIHITDANIATDPSHTMGTIYYPPLPVLINPVTYSFSTTSTMNGFNISLEQLTSVPSTARNLSTCVHSAYSAVQLWTDGSDNQTLSIVVVDGSEGFNSTFRINATAIIVSGTLSSYGNYTEFALNGASWPNVMSTGNRWAQDIISVICNATLPPFTGTCSPGSSLSDFVTLVESSSSSFNWDLDEQYRHWGSVLSMALGAYSSAMFSTASQNETMISDPPGIAVPTTSYGAQFTSTYGIYILLLNIIVSIAMLIIVVGLRMTSHLGPDFLNSTRLLLDPLKKPELFNASLQTTVDTLGDPYMLVADNVFLLAGLGEQKMTRSPGGNVSERLPHENDRTLR